MRHQHSIFGTAMCCILLMCSTSLAGKKDKPRVPSKPAKIMDIKLNLVPFITGGMVIGKAAEQIERYGGSTIDNALYGGGLSLSYYPKPRYAVAFNLAYVYKELPGEDVTTGRGWIYSGSFILNLRTQVRYVTYTRIDIGLVSASWPRRGDDLSLGTHPLFRLGLGVFTFTAGSVNTRFEAYYMHAFSKGHTVDGWVDQEIPYNAQCFGVELGIGFPISKR